MSDGIGIVIISGMHTDTALSRRSCGRGGRLSQAMSDGIGIFIISGMHTDTALSAARW